MPSKVFDNDKGKHNWPEETICELHREIYDLLFIYLGEDSNLFQNILPKLEKAYIAGMKMTKKLLDYKLSLPEWEQHANKSETERLRKLRVELTERLNVASK